MEGGMSFIWINMLWLLLLLPVLILAYILVQRRRQKYALRYASLSLVRGAIGSGPGRRRHIPAILFLIGVMAIIGALARPTAAITLPSQESTVILTVDVSGSMRAEDLKPSRFEAAKSAALLFVEKQPHNVHIGVVAFGESAVVVQAPTADREAVIGAINRLTLMRGTAIGLGIITSLDAIFESPDAELTPSSPDSLELFEPSPIPPPVAPGTYASAVVVLLSDGQSNRGPQPLEIIEQASNRGVRVYTVGVGSPEGTILRFRGRAVRVRLDEETLKGIAGRTGASYFKADSETDLREIYENLSTQLVIEAEQTEITALFTGLAVVFLLIAGTLSLLWFHRLL
jgi:Ca-activated chloride channel family protein